jgi:SAM-dependent methyltransferase
MSAYHRLVQFFKRSALGLQWGAHQGSADFDRRVPPPGINYNQQLTYSLRQYLDDFKRQSCLHELPGILKLAPNPKGEDFALLDYGCGLGRIAYAFTSYFRKTGSYYGYEIHPTALAFLKKAYEGYPNARFMGEPIQVSESYVEVAQGAPRSAGDRIKSEDVRVSRVLDKKVDVQWSCSVFTHMYEQPIINVLRDFNTLLKPGGICVNTWLVVDEFAQSALDCGLADRKLPFEIDGFLTYSKENPLLCSAYRIRDVRRIYEAAGQKIVEILWGSWSGRQNDLTSQDVIVSVPIDR